MREELKLIVDVGGTWDADLSRVMTKLTEMKGLAEAVEDITIDVDVRDSELDALMGKMAAANMGDATNVTVGDGSRTGAAPPPSPSVGDGIDFRRVQTAQLGRLIKDLDSDFSDLSKSMGNTMSAADKAADTFELSNLRMSDLHNAVARLVPLILVFVGALPALIAGVVSLAAAAFSAAAALAAITAFGALGFTMVEGDFGDITDRIQADFMDAFGPLARDLAPLFQDGLAGLERFFDALAARGDVLRAFADDARAFGAFLIDYLPDAIANMGRLADASSEMFGVIADGLRDISFTEAFANFLAQALPTLRAFAGALIDFLPTLVNISTGFLAIVNAIMWTVGALGWMLSLLPITEQTLGAMVAILLTATSAYLIFSSAIMKGAVNALITLGTHLLAAISSMTGFSASAIVSTAAAYGLSKAVLAVAGAIGTLLAISGIGLLLPILGGIASQFLGINQNIQDATDSLKEFRDVGRRMDDNPYGPEPDIDDELDRYTGGSGSSMGSPTIEVTDSEDFDTKLQNNQFRDWSNAT
jgi:hypothetical protein